MASSVLDPASRVVKMLQALWEEHVEGRLSPFWIYVVGTFLTHELAWAIFNLPYMLADRFGWWQQYKIFKVGT